MEQEIRIACGQFAAQPGDAPANVARMIGYAGQARAEGCALILFPELIVTGYLAPERVRPLAEPLAGPSVRRLCLKLCASCFRRRRIVEMEAHPCRL